MAAKKRKAPWDRPAPKKKTASKRKGAQKLTSTQKQTAKKRAKRAGRPYPNLVDNMAVAKKAKKRKS